MDTPQLLPVSEGVPREEKRDNSSGAGGTGQEEWLHTERGEVQDGYVEEILCCGVGEAHLIGIKGIFVVCQAIYLPESLPRSRGMPG